MEPLRVDAALSDLRWLLESVAGRRTELVIECEEGLPPARFDAGAFRRIVVNLVESAGASMRDRGRIEVRAAAEPERVVLTVADNGSGIRQPTRVHGIAVANGAEVRIASTPGEGSKFSIYLPVWV